MTGQTFLYDDGGRASTGYKGTAGDCAVRAISIATGQSYQKVYDDLNQIIKTSRQTKIARDSSARNGIHRRFYQTYLEKLGWKWVPTMTIGSGCKIHLKKEELPSGRVIAQVSKHLVTLIDGIIHDTYDCSRNGTRCVYGYFVKE